MTPVLVSPSWSLVGGVRSSVRFRSPVLAGRVYKLVAKSPSLSSFLTAGIHPSLSFGCLIFLNLYFNKSLVLQKRSCMCSLYVTLLSQAVTIASTSLFSSNILLSPLGIIIEELINDSSIIKLFHIHSSLLS